MRSPLRHALRQGPGGTWHTKTACHDNEASRSNPVNRAPTGRRTVPIYWLKFARWAAGGMAPWVASDFHGCGTIRGGRFRGRKKIEGSCSPGQEPSGWLSGLGGLALTCSRDPQPYGAYRAAKRRNFNRARIAVTAGMKQRPAQTWGAMHDMSRIAKLALEDGTVYTGFSFGATGEVDGEVCFNTSMTGYQEILTDPSYKGQIVTMTYPEIGNYGVNLEDLESAHPHLSGFVVRNQSKLASNFRADGPLEAYLARHGVIGISGIDTRALVRRLRIHGSLKGILSTVDLDDASLVAKAKASPGLVGRDLVREVVPAVASHWTEQLNPLARTSTTEAARPRRRAAAARDRVGLWHEMEHCPASGQFRLSRHGAAGHRHCGRSAGPESGRRLSVQRSRRSGAAGIRHRHDPRIARTHPGVWHLPRASTPVTGLRRQDV